MKLRKELWFGFTLMAIILTVMAFVIPWTNLTNGHLGLVMLGLVVVTIMLGFPTAFTLMGMGVFFAWLYYNSIDPHIAVRQVLDLMVQRAYSVMSNDVLIAIPLFVFMGYLVERANLIEKLFKSLHLALARVPGSLAVATIVTCAIFATATGIVGAVVTLMGLLALPAMLRSGYSVQLAAGAITAGGCLGILIPPSVLLIVYGATAGVSVVQLYAGAFFPGIMLALLYVGYVIIVAKWKPHLAPPLSESERIVPLPPLAAALAPRNRNALKGLLRGMRDPALPKGTVFGQLFVSLIPALVVGGLLALTFISSTNPVVAVDTAWSRRVAPSPRIWTRNQPSPPRDCRKRLRKARALPSRRPRKRSSQRRPRRPRRRRPRRPRPLPRPLPGKANACPRRPGTGWPSASAWPEFS
jgi:TRAP-type mannitol/chloroaromatic compound transport system permease large subunit